MESQLQFRGLQTEQALQLQGKKKRYNRDAKPPLSPSAPCPCPRPVRLHGLPQTPLCSCSELLLSSQLLPGVKFTFKSVWTYSSITLSEILPLNFFFPKKIYTGHLLSQHSEFFQWMTISMCTGTCWIMLSL